MGKIHSLPTALVLYLCAADNKYLNEALPVSEEEMLRAEKYLLSQGLIVQVSSGYEYTHAGVTFGKQLNQHLNCDPWWIDFDAG